MQLLCSFCAMPLPPCSIVPFPASQMKQLERKDGGNKASLRDPARSERMREALKMKYVMGVEAAGGRGGHWEGEG